ncbi:MAG: NAD(P)H-hydrate epimerase [Phycisphaerales bacterium]|nr:NAD(P)H-hydrate epimerase [Phycisphaerales bacterium]
MNNASMVYTRAGLRELDRRTVEEFGIPILVLMENAGRAVAEAARRMLQSQDQSPGIAIPGFHATGKVLVLAGTGNNGGDGLVAARHLHNWGVKVSVLLLAEREKYKNAAGMQLAIVEKMKLPVDVIMAGLAAFQSWLTHENGEGDVIVDAIFGTGLSRPVEGLAAEEIRAANHANRRILAVDIPSGMDADTGKELGVAIRATETVSFCGMKRGFLQTEAKTFTGHVTVAEIGAPRELLAELADRSIH